MRSDRNNSDHVGESHKEAKALTRYVTPTPRSTGHGSLDSACATAEHKIDVKVGHVHETAGFEFYENVTPSLRTVAKLKSISISGRYVATLEAVELKPTVGRSKWQKMDIIETEAFGKTLVLDTKTQSAASDEHMYHETLVHPIMFAHPNPRTVRLGNARSAKKMKSHVFHRCSLVEAGRWPQLARFSATRQWRRSSWLTLIKRYWLWHEQHIQHNIRTVFATNRIVH